MEEKDLIKQIINGDKKAFEKLVDLYKDRAFAFAYVRLRNREDAIELVQELFIKIYYNLKKFDLNKKFFSWLYKIEMNMIKNYYRQKKNNKQENYDKENTDFSFWENEYLSVEDKMTLMEAIYKLKEDEKDIIFLRYFQSLNDKEIGEILGISPENVRTKFFRAKEKLLDLLEKGGFSYE
ncbi:MAG: RNA polymerase sigma factor [Brevinematales bacterium]|nr:RNA polymerase sigma factor [Brevinematales bacterium]